MYTKITIDYCQTLETKIDKKKEIYSINHWNWLKLLIVKLLKQPPKQKPITFSNTNTAVFKANTTICFKIQF